jgi:5-methylcytosine-specific restriction endonuclease McrA
VITGNFRLERVSLTVPAGKTREEYNAYMAKYMKRRIAERRARAVEQLGGKCILCGSTENLEFDHIDRRTKACSIGKLWTYSEEKLQAELRKCQILCRECHLRKTTAEKLESGQKVHHGGGLTGKKNCYCSLCKPLKVVYNMNYRKRASRTIVS